MMIYCINIHGKCAQMILSSKQSCGHEGTHLKINYVDENLQAHDVPEARCEVWLLAYC
jgi:hypothetical protein